MRTWTKGRGNVLHMPPQWAVVEPYCAKTSPWALVVVATTDTYPVVRVEQLAIDPYAELVDGCLVVVKFKGSSPFLAGCAIREGRGYRGFVRKGSDDETYSFDGIAVSRGNLKRGKIIRVLGRVVGDPRRFPRCHTWDDPD